jgi:hypothetical protein
MLTVMQLLYMGSKAVAGTQLKVNAGGVVNISGYSAPENVLPNVYVTMNGGSMDLGGSFGETYPPAPFSSTPTRRSTRN